MWDNKLDEATAAVGIGQWTFDGVQATVARPPRATTAPTVLVNDGKDGGGLEAVPPGEAYRLTDEYHKLYYAQFPRDPRMLPPLRASHTKPGNDLGLGSPRRSGGGGSAGGLAGGAAASCTGGSFTVTSSRAGGSGGDVGGEKRSDDLLLPKDLLTDGSGPSGSGPVDDDDDIVHDPALYLQLAQSLLVQQQQTSSLPRRARGPRR